MCFIIQSYGKMNGKFKNAKYTQLNHFDTIKYDKLEKEYCCLILLRITAFCENNNKQT